MTNGPPPIEPKDELSHDEQIRILEAIARTGSDSNRIQAIRELRRLEGEDPDNAQEDELEELIRRK